MAVLKSYQENISNIFQLLGDKENDMSKAFCWVMFKCPLFLKAVIKRVCDIDADISETVIYNQQSGLDNGFTDIEITDGKLFHVIFEAKRGWQVPKKEQLEKYSSRLLNSRVQYKRIVSLSEASEEYANVCIPFKNIAGIPVLHLSYKEVFKIAQKTCEESNHEQTHLLHEFCDYLGGIMTMQNQTSNWVYVVSLGKGTLPDCEITWIDVVKNLNRYFCPVGVKGWPKEPPNYIAFRYDGKLQSIHHIEGYSVTRNAHSEIPELPDFGWEVDHFVFVLGDPIIPTRDIKSGKVYPNGRVWAMLDTLLTSDTVSDARDISYARVNK